MAHETLGVSGDRPESRSTGFSLRRLFGLHEHVYGPWLAQSASPEGSDRMMLVMVRECAHCSHFQLERQIADVPAEGFPAHLNFPVRLRESQA